MLHIVNKSPFERPSLDACLRSAQSNDAVIFIEDGIIAATQGTVLSDKVENMLSSFKVYALKADVDARGLSNKVIEGIEVINYGQFVELVVENGTPISWL
jgi:tRNA 2-thiouridine synthesizing protein B